MLNIKYIVTNKEKFLQLAKNRNINVDTDDLIEFYGNNKDLISIIQNLQEEKNDLIKKISIKKRNNKDSDSEILKTVEINKKIKIFEEKLKVDNNKLSEIIAALPNFLSQDVPNGKDENDNIEIKKWGVVPKFKFIPKKHYDLDKKMKMLDFEFSVGMSGSRFSSFLSDLALLERALSNFMLDKAKCNGYTEVSPPNLVKRSAMFKAGQLPKFENEAFCTKEDYWLIPTSEVPLVNILSDKLLKENDLPIKFSAYTACFRREAGSAGKDTKGLIRKHQFKKVELVVVTNVKDSQEEHEKITLIAESILEDLNLPYRRVLLCSGDTGFCSSKTYDLEVWMAGQNKYREISSCSNCTDFQARRANIKYKDDKGKKHYVHTLNGSSLAIDRTIAAILENYQNEDGSVTIPQVLKKYLDFDKIFFN